MAGPLCAVAISAMIGAAMWTAPAQGAVVLLDAEADADMAAWSGVTRVQAGDAPLSSIGGIASARLRVRAKEKIDGDYHGVRCSTPPVTDWQPYDRLVMDVVNDGSVRTLMRIRINTATNDAKRQFALPPGRWVRIVLPTSQLDPQNADLGRVNGIRLSFDMQPKPLDLCLDNILLLKPGETAPALNMAFLAEVIRRLAAERDGVERTHMERRAAFTTPRAAQIAGWCEGGALAELQDIRRLLHVSDTPLDKLMAAGERIDRAALALSRIPSIVEFDQACEKAGARYSEDVLVGTAGSMVKLMPREMPVEFQPAKAISLSAARNETESVQLAVLPLRQPLRKVSIRVDDLRSNRGHILPRSQIDCDLMGYVETRELPSDGFSYVGWWPDPILASRGPVDVAAGDLQSFWIRVRVPKDQPPGEYRGEIAMEGEGINRVVVPLAVRVHSFAVPDWSPLPTAVSFGPPLRPFSVILEDLIASSRWNGGLKYRWADCLARYYISYDQLYRRECPDFDIIDHLHKAGRLGAFNLGNFDVPKADEGKAVDPNALAEMLDRVGIAYKKAKDRGLLDHAYIYGFDEVKPEWFDTVEQAAAAVKQRMPGALVLTTAYDHSFGRDTKMTSIDGWTPKTEKYDADLAAQSRARGDQVWWYICIEPKHPHANIFLEYPAVEARLLMGAMTAKYRPDGFLYYQTSLWQASEPIRTGPFTNWDPRSYRDAHGDGSWLCMDADGLPVPTIRLENYRDGLEDYAYVQLLEEAIRMKKAGAQALTAQERRWLSEATAALTVPQELVTSLTEYSRDPARLYAWRERLADLIERSGIRDLDPWRDGFTFARKRKAYE